MTPPLPTAKTSWRLLPHTPQSLISVPLNMSCQSAAGAEIVPALRSDVLLPAGCAPSGGDDDQDGQHGSQAADHCAAPAVKKALIQHVIPLSCAR